jgi:hypothetical protein
MERFSWLSLVGTVLGPYCYEIGQSPDCKTNRPFGPTPRRDHTEIHVFLTTRNQIGAVCWCVDLHLCGAFEGLVDKGWLSRRKERVRQVTRCAVKGQAKVKGDKDGRFGPPSSYFSSSPTAVQFYGLLTPKSVLPLPVFI